MLEIKNLTKIYKSSRKEKCIAINDVSLDLPSTGMIFITGKSGSGKSTLLNMIGTLDNITSGDIIVDGVSFKTFNAHDFQKYRSSYLGFIFQDFLLLDEFTVLENVSLALKLSGMEDEEYLHEIIKKVGLEDKTDKFPTELSGGQKQRVAIARSLVKKPKMLLCDEPTGNLDYKTSKQILDILKEESKTKLVIIVSHNTEDAENYADRIIELMDGKIVKDYTKNQDYNNDLIITDKYIVLPHHKDLTRKEVSQLNEIVKTEKVKIKQNKGGFFPTKEVDKTISEFELKSSNLGFKNSTKLSSMFFRKNKRSVPYTILITALFISLFYIFQVFVSFNPNLATEEIRSEKSLSSINLTEQTLTGSLSSSSLITIKEEQINNYYEAGYQGNIYKLYNFGPSLGANVLTIGSYTRITALLNYTDLRETYGTLCCNEQYLKQLFNDVLDENGNLKLLAGSLDKCYNKIIITDYVADQLINSKTSNYDSYESIVKKSYTIRAVIDTGYKQTHASILEKAKTAKKNKMTHTQFHQNYSDDAEMIEFLKDVQARLAINYTFANNFYEDIFGSYTPSQLSINNLYCSDGEINNTCESSWVIKSSGLQNNEINMSYSAFNEIFGTFYSSVNASTFEPMDMVIRRYYGNDPNNEVEFEIKVRVVGLSSITTVSKNVYKELYKAKYQNYCLHFDNLEQYDLVKEVSDQNKFYIATVDTSVIPVINTILTIFNGLCYLIIVLLFIVIFTHIVFFGIHSIKRNIYEIGVLKALGAKTFDIGIIFIAQIALIGFLISATSILGIWLSTWCSDLLLISAFEQFLTITIYGINIISMQPNVVTLDLTLVFVISIISSIIPQIYLMTIKPLNILKGKKK